MSDSSNLIAATCDKITCSYREDRNIPEGTMLDGNDGYIALKNVTINNGKNPFNIPFLCVFYDQIIGVSIGKIN